jgi:hypothetical protein
VSTPAKGDDAVVAFNPNRVNANRSFALMAIGLLVGLALAGYSLFTAKGTSTLYVPPEDVALVNQQPISRIDYLAQLQALFAVDLEHATSQQKMKVLDDMIREELFVQRGKELDVASFDPQVRNATINAVEMEIASDAITAQPSDEKLRAYYDVHRGKYSSEGIMTVHDYVFPVASRAAASEAAAALESGPPNPELFDRLKEHESGKVGDEQFYFAAKIHLGDRLFEVAKALPDAGASVVVAMPDGLHVLYMAKNKRPVPLDFSAARDQVLNDFRNDAIGHLRAGDEAFLRRRANVLVADDLR